MTLTRSTAVHFREKSSWQKDDCINNSAEISCSEPSTLEAVSGNASIRCCISAMCKARAAEIALTLGGIVFTQDPNKRN